MPASPPGAGTIPGTMNRFLHGHATHPDWRVALALAAAQIEARRREPGHAATPTLGWVYLTDACAPHAEALLGELQRRWPGVEWVGASGIGIAAGGVEYAGEPALALMLTDLAPAHFRVFSGARPLTGFDAHTANVHADPRAADLADLVHDMSARTATGYLFGGLASAPSRLKVPSTRGNVPKLRGCGRAWRCSSGIALPSEPMTASGWATKRATSSSLR